MTTATARKVKTPPTRPAPSRPTINTPLPSDDAGPTTVGDYIIAQIDKGVYPLTAAQAAGVSQAEYTNWIREGQLVMARLNGGAQWETDFTPEQQDFAVFATQAVQAHARHVTRLTIVADQVALGGIEKRQVRTKSGINRAEGDKPAEPWSIVTETVEHTLPDTNMLQWRLEHAEPTVYGRNATLNVNVVDLTDTTQIGELVAERMAAIVKRLRPVELEAPIEEAEVVE